MKTSKRESSGFGELFVGFFEAKVVAICPDKEGLENLGFSPEEEPVYVKENKDGVDTARIDVYLQDVKTQKIFKKSFFVENTEVIQKVKDGMTEDEIADFVAKNQYINVTGDTGWAADEADLFESFKNFTEKPKGSDKWVSYAPKSFRVALQGEGDFMDFVKKWLGDVNYKAEDTDILLDMSKIFAGDFSQLQEMVGSEVQTNTVELAEVRTVEKEDGDVAQYQSVYKTSLPGYVMGKVRTLKFTDEAIAGWKKAQKTKNNPDGRYLKAYEKFAIEITGEYGSKNHFELTALKPYDEAADTVAKDSTAPTGAKVVVEDDASY